jgi:hypothetical protein
MGRSINQPVQAVPIGGIVMMPESVQSTTITENGMEYLRSGEMLPYDSSNSNHAKLAGYGLKTGSYGSVGQTPFHSKDIQATPYLKNSFFNFASVTEVKNMVFAYGKRGIVIPARKQNSSSTDYQFNPNTYYFSSFDNTVNKTINMPPEVRIDTSATNPTSVFFERRTNLTYSTHIKSWVFCETISEYHTASVGYFASGLKVYVSRDGETWNVIGTMMMNDSYYYRIMSSNGHTTDNYIRIAAVGNEIFTIWKVLESATATINSTAFSRYTISDDSISLSQQLRQTTLTTTSYTAFAYVNANKVIAAFKNQGHWTYVHVITPGYELYDAFYSNNFYTNSSFYSMGTGNSCIMASNDTQILVGIASNSNQDMAHAITYIIQNEELATSPVHTGSYNPPNYYFSLKTDYESSNYESIAWLGTYWLNYGYGTSYTFYVPFTASGVNAGVVKQAMPTYAGNFQSISKNKIGLYYNNNNLFVYDISAGTYINLGTLPEQEYGNRTISYITFNGSRYYSGRSAVFQLDSSGFATRVYTPTANFDYAGSTSASLWVDNLIIANNTLFYYSKNLSNKVYSYSTDGINWTQVTVPATCGKIYDISYIGGKYVFTTSGGSTHNFFYTTDHITLTPGLITVVANYYKLVVTGSTMTALPGAGNLNLYTSTDGVAWSSGAIFGDTSTTIRAIVNHNSTWYVYRSNNSYYDFKVYTSSNGTTWTASATSIKFPYYKIPYQAISFNNKIYLLMVDSFSMPSDVYSTTDGITLTPVPMPPSFNQFTSDSNSADKTFMYVENNKLMINSGPYVTVIDSTDGASYVGSQNTIESPGAIGYIRIK